MCAAHAQQALWQEKGVEGLGREDRKAAHRKDVDRHFGGSYKRKGNGDSAILHPVTFCDSAGRDE